MDANLLHGSVERSISSPNKNSRIRTSRINTQLHCCTFSSLDNLCASHFQAAVGLPHAPPSSFHDSHFYPPRSLWQPPQPPLLPLPAPADSRRSNAVRGQSCPPSKKGNNGRRNRDSSLTPKKSSSPNQKPCRKFSTVLSVSSFPAENQMIDDIFSGSVAFKISPPPSSLPLPTFSLRPKLGCNAEAAAGIAEIDAGATDNLRRLLRLR